MSRLIVSLAFLLLVTTGCSTIKSVTRMHVDGTPADLVTGQFEPDADEGCTQKGTYACEYSTGALSLSNNAFGDDLEACSKQAAPKAQGLNANYLYIDMPSSVGGVRTSAPVVYIYQCTNLKISD